MGQGSWAHLMGQSPWAHLVGQGPWAQGSAYGPGSVGPSLWAKVESKLCALLLVTSSCPSPLPAKFCPDVSSLLDGMPAAFLVVVMGSLDPTVHCLLNTSQMLVNYRTECGPFFLRAVWVSRYIATWHHMTLGRMLHGKEWCRPGSILFSYVASVRV